MTVVSYVNPVALCGLVCFQTVMCLLIFEFYKDASYRAPMLSLELLCAQIGAKIIGCVRPVSL